MIKYGINANVSLIPTISKMQHAMPLPTKNHNFIWLPNMFIIKSGRKAICLCGLMHRGFSNIFVKALNTINLGPCYISVTFNHVHVCSNKICPEQLQNHNT
jgi:hypothetical protein